MSNQLNAKLQTAKELLVGPLAKFIPARQREAIASNLRGNERGWFADKMIELHDLIEKMPHTYQTKGQGTNAVAYLHYFGGGSFNAWITEKDVDGGTQQAYGRQDIYGDGGDIGYVCIDEIVASKRCELDLHWTPIPLKECGKDGKD